MAKQWRVCMNIIFQWIISGRTQRQLLALYATHTQTHTHTLSIYGIYQNPEYTDAAVQLHNNSNYLNIMFRTTETNEHSWILQKLALKKQYGQPYKIRHTINTNQMAFFSVPPGKSKDCQNLLLCCCSFFCIYIPPLFCSFVWMWHWIYLALDFFIQK